MRSRYDLIPAGASADGLATVLEALGDIAYQRHAVEAATAVLHTLTADCVEPVSTNHSADASAQPWEGSAMWF
jgi:hypothetical protein